jgi:hypothetical protein
MVKPTVLTLSVIMLLVLSFPLGVRPQNDKAGTVAMFLRGGNAEELVNDCAAVERFDLQSTTAPPKDASRLSFCLGYIVGVVDMRNALNAVSKDTSPFCVPDDASTTQLAKVVVKYGTDHPEQLNQPALLFISEAFTQSFRCK